MRPLEKLLYPVSLVLFIVLLFSPINASASSTAEAKVLLKWKTTLRSANNSLLISWVLLAHNGSTSSSPCNWFGVSCNAEGSVLRLNLTNSNLHGTLYKFSFSSFPNLAYFDLSLNQLFGSIPPLISSLSKLIYLDLSINQFSGNIPPEIGLLINLQTLYLDQNQFSGSIFLYNNNLSGSIPKELGNLKSLINLALSTNNLLGPIPASLGNLSNLTHLYLYLNQLSGSIPPEMGNLANLVELFIWANK